MRGFLDLTRGEICGDLLNGEITFGKSSFRTDQLIDLRNHKLRLFCQPRNQQASLIPSFIGNSWCCCMSRTSKGLCFLVWSKFTKLFKMDRSIAASISLSYSLQTLIPLMLSSSYSNHPLTFTIDLAFELCLLQESSKVGCQLSVQTTLHALQFINYHLQMFLILFHYRCNVLESWQIKKAFYCNFLQQSYFPL